MQDVGRVVPVLYQEPFRRGYTDWEPNSDDFLTDLRGALESGAAGWCFHNGQEKAGKQPARSFDMRSKRLFDQLDSEEVKVVTAAAGLVRLWQPSTISGARR